METNFRAIRRQKKAKRQILVGDLNIALANMMCGLPALKNVVSHTAVEIAALARVQAKVELGRCHAISCRPGKNSIAGGAIVRATGRLPIADGGRPYLGDTGAEDVTGFRYCMPRLGAPSDHAPVVLDVTQRYL